MKHHKSILLLTALAVLLQGCHTQKAIEKQSVGQLAEDYFLPGYSAHSQAPRYKVVEEKVSRQAWEEAFAHRTEYNYYRDTTNENQRYQSRLAAFRALNDDGKEAYAVYHDIVFGNEGFFAETDEGIVDIWYANEQEAAFVKNGVMDSVRIAGSDYGVYGKNRIFVGCAGFDCDPCVYLFFYQIVDKPWHHTQFLCHYANRAQFMMYGDNEGALDDWDEVNRNQHGAILWYKDGLYYRAIDGGEVVYYRLRLEKI